MKRTIVLAAALLALGACSHRQTRSNTEVSRASGVREVPQNPTHADTGTVSGAPSSLGAVSSGRGH